MNNETDYTQSAEKLFREFASKHGLQIEKEDQQNIELIMTVPRQDGLSFELTLGLQNLDEINIGFDGFWSYFFPFEEKEQHVIEILDGIVDGTTRLVKRRQFGSVVVQDLELNCGDGWKRVYREYCGIFFVPFLPSHASIVSNSDR